VTDSLERHAVQLSALGHPVRLQILRFVVQAGVRGASAGDIQTKVGVPASTSSHHLKRLVQCDLLQAHGEGTFHYYSADYGSVRKLTEFFLWKSCCMGGAQSGTSKPDDE
jgi:DNA-binding transcriptional ArsR family regulator